MTRTVENFINSLQRERDGESKVLREWQRQRRRESRGRQRKNERVSERERQRRRESRGRQKKRK